MKSGKQSLRETNTCFKGFCAILCFKLVMRGLLLAGCFVASLYTFGQSDAEPCGQTAYEQYLETQFPGIKSHFTELRRSASRHVLQSKHAKNQDHDTVFKIPVVFHVLYNNTLENISDELIFSQMRVLNEAYRHIHPDTNRVRLEFEDRDADAGIEFYLASEDPNGNPTTGINRVQTNVTTFMPQFQFTENMKRTVTGGVVAWNTDKYLNIWVCDISISGNDVLLGYAFPPTGAANWRSGSYTSSQFQGVVLHYKIVGENNSLANFNSRGGKTAIHEVGHYLGLRHVWGDPQGFQDGCSPSVDDGIEDTPISKTNHSGRCNFFSNTCGVGQTGDLPDMVENYMDYSTDDCQVMFTKQQVQMMRYNLLFLRPQLSQMEIKTPPEPEIAFTSSTVSPNPIDRTAQVYFKTPSETADPVTMKIYNMMGQQVANYNLTTNEVHDVVFQFGANGHYIARVYSESDELVHKQLLVVMTR